MVPDVRRGLLPLALVALPFAAGCAARHSAARAPAPAPSAAPTASPTAQPMASPPTTPVIYVPQSPAPQPFATTAAVGAPKVRLSSPVPSHLATPAAPPRITLRAADAPPQILSMSLSTPVAHGGQIVTGTVRTSSNVASVEARIAGYSSTLTKTGEGVFQLAQRVPALPFFLHRTYEIDVIARNTAGAAVSSEIPITIR